jgi:hypothetical protein
MCTTFWEENRKGRHHFEHKNVDIMLWTEVNYLGEERAIVVDFAAWLVIYSYFVIRLITWNMSDSWERNYNAV